MAKTLEGGCFCGDIRYQIKGEAVFQLYCFCKDCVKITGTDGYAGYMVKDENFSLIKGVPKTHNKQSNDGKTVVRSFCGTCGSNLWGNTEFGLTSVAAGSLDNPDEFKPASCAFVHDAPKWARVPEELAKV